MLRTYIRWREEQMAQADDAKKIATPFALGTDILLGAKGGCHSLEALLEHTRCQLADSAAFFEPQAGQDYSYGDGILTFPSGLMTESEENNLVWCRVFERPSRPSKDQAIVILPHWNAKPVGYDRLAKICSWAGITGVRMSLPYHDQRRPPHMKIAEYMVSPNLGMTIRSVRQAVLDARLVIRWLAQRGYKKIGIVGASIGSGIATTVAAHEPRVSAAVLLLVAHDFGEVVWTSRATRHIRKAFDGKLTLEQLKEAWAIISPNTYVPHLRKRAVPVLAITAREYTVFKPYLSRQFIDALHREGVNYSWKALPCGHYTLAVVPFNAYTVFSNIRFLKDSL